MLKHRKEARWGEPERRKECRNNWFERYGLIITTIGATFGVLATCWGIVLKQADPHIDSRFDLKIVTVNERLDQQDKKISKFEECIESIAEIQKFNKEMLLQHLSTGEITRASEAYRIRYVLPEEAKE